MPLKRGRSAKVISQNIAELIKTYKETGKIGASHPRTLAAARRQAVAIAMQRAGKSTSKRKH